MKRLSMHAGCCLLSLLWGPGFGEARFDRVPGSRYSHARALGMGDAFVPISEEIMSGLFYQPANLMKIRRRKLEFVNLGADAGSRVIWDYLSLSNALSIWQLQTFKGVLDTKPNVWSDVGFFASPAFVLGNIGVGLLYEQRMAAKSNGNGTYRIRSLYQLVPAIGTGFRLFRGIVKVGYALQWVQKGEGDHASVLGSEAKYDYALSQGSAVSHHFGLSLNFPWRYLPSLHAVVRNAFNARYTPFMLWSFTSAAVGLPATEVMTLDLALSFQPQLSQQIGTAIVIEARDALGVSGYGWPVRLAIGGEFAIASTFIFRGGWGSGYPSAGIGLRHQSNELLFSWGSEEVGPVGASNRMERYMLQYFIKAF
jgi:hypothetical protein